MQGIVKHGPTSMLSRLLGIHVSCFMWIHYVGYLSLLKVLYIVDDFICQQNVEWASEGYVNKFEL